MFLRNTSRHLCHINSKHGTPNKCHSSFGFKGRTSITISTDIILNSDKKARYLFKYVHINLLLFHEFGFPDGVNSGENKLYFNNITQRYF